MSRHRVCTTRGARWRSSANTALEQRLVDGEGEFGGARQALSADVVHGEMDVGLARGGHRTVRQHLGDNLDGHPRHEVGTTDHAPHVPTNKVGGSTTPLPPFELDSPQAVRN